MKISLICRKCSEHFSRVKGFTLIANPLERGTAEIVYLDVILRERLRRIPTMEIFTTTPFGFLALHLIETSFCET